MNSVILVGRLTKDPELKFMSGSGTPVTSFTIAIDRDYSKKDGSKDTDFIPVEVVGKIAESCANYLGKGRLIALEGSIKVDRYQTQSGENRTFTKVSAKKVKFLESKNKSNQEADNNGHPTFEPHFTPADGLDPNGFQAIDDDEIPF
ncbi:MAG TPA: single-stranded DNA-binding protein [Terrisporobacter glycolicus]|uniref:single-stranded DNA-binding protein n=1 Tax=Terrisporobacter TaxID=1505652 RepID=UPI000E8300AB|nr:MULTISPECIES: single-stranded DNA-binding protein [Terrisporobacter]HBI91189.1 single-stranded DNA-binding protein [Terrisporobacter hibernicus]